MKLPSAASRSVHAMLVLVAAVLLALAYRETLHAPFVFDDRRAILENPTIRQLWPLSVPLAPPADGRAVGGRPLVNLSLALNYAWSATEPWTYHLVNLALHALCAALLFGLVRRTLASPFVRGRFGPAAWPLGWVIASLWALHPLQTESVTCVVQRTEVLAAFFYLLTLYAFVRGMDSPARARAWFTVAVGACLLGVAAKETLVTAPLIVWLYDRTFVAGSFRSAWRARRNWYLGLAASWLPLLWLIARGGGGRGSAAGFGGGMSSWAYLQEQTRAILLYLKLSVWPHPLVVDYGSSTPSSFTEVLGPGLVVLALLAATVWALIRRPLAGFLGAGFFLLLAPSSSFVPLAAQTVAEHRMYLPLATLIVGAVVGLFSLSPRKTTWLAVPVLLACAWLTAQRNRVYRSEIALWSDTVVHQASNPRVQLNLGAALLDAGQLDAAAGAFEAAARLQPNLPAPHANLCHVYVQLGRFADAVAQGEAAVELAPDDAAARLNLAQALIRTGETPAARQQLAALAQLNATDAQLPYLAGNLAVAAEDFGLALEFFRRAVALDPASVPARNNLANVLFVSRRFDEAIQEYEIILRQRPEDRRVRENLDRARELQGARTD